MCQRYAAAAVAAVLENRPRVLERLVARRPDALALAWTAILQTLGAVAGIETERLFVPLVPLMRGAGRQMSLDEPIDTGGNRMVHWSAMYGHADDLALFKRYGADLRAANRLETVGSIAKCESPTFAGVCTSEAPLGPDLPPPRPR